MHVFALPLVGLLAGFLATGLLRRWLTAAGVVDVPDGLSAHSTPVPRGGGLGIAVIVLLGVLLTALAGLISPAVAAALGGGGVVVAVVGWIDDCYGLRARYRAAAQFAAVVWALVWLGGYPNVTVGHTSVYMGAWGFALATVGIVWGINFFNFMDGIDGVAGAEAVIVGLVGGLLFWHDHQPAFAGIAFLTAGAAAGFLPWNWGGARIFLGDVGSTFLGFTFCTLAVAGENAGSVSLFTWATLLGVFVFDATVTLVRRVNQGHPLYERHREFAFHRAVRDGRTHAQVSTRIALINLVLAALGVYGWASKTLLLPTVGVGALMLTAIYIWLERRIPMRRDNVPSPWPIPESAAPNGVSTGPAAPRPATSTELGAA